MSTNTSPPLPKPNRQILDEASAWFVEFRVGDTELDSRAEFDRWLRQSPQHIRAYLETARAYHELSGLDSERVARLCELISTAQSDQNIVRLEPNSSDEPASEPVSSERPNLRRWIPASLAAAVIAGLVVWITLPTYQTYSTGVGENRTVTMPDASTITLNAVTKLRVRYTKTERVIDLVSGQAFFQVTANTHRPFVVRSGFAVVRDVGTQFDVDSTAGSTTVTVVEGRVVLYSASSRTDGSSLPPELPQDSGRSPAVLLAAGEQAVVSAHEISTQTHANIGAATSWLKHRFIFDGSPLSDVVDQFNRYNSRQIIIDDAALNGLRISGVYSSTDPDSFLRFLGTQPGIEVTQTDGAIHIDRK